MGGTRTALLARPDLDVAPPHGAGALGDYVRGLDGLRAASMAVVLLYHGEVGGVRGGFLGISLFFTLSGFLITSLLLRGHVIYGRVDLRAFWAQRYRRLLPAAYLALGAALVFGATVATEQQVNALPGAVVACLAQVANWHFVLTKQSYAALFSGPSPVQHFWSLAIEEQFYLVMPLLLLLLLRRRSMRLVAGLLAVGVVGSTVLMVVLFERGASLDRLYYGTDTRAAELFMGALLAVVIHARPQFPSGRLRPLLPLVGVAAGAFLAWCFTQLSFTDAILYRGGFLAVSTASAALILSVLGGRGPVATVLSLGPVAAFGRITYGVYLVHWPLFLWLTEQRTGLDAAPLLLLRVAVTLVVAVASYHLVEMPVRRRRWRRLSPNLRWAIPPAAAIIVLAAFGVGQRDVQTDLAGLDEAATAMPPLAVQGDGVLDVLVIADAGGARIGPSLHAEAKAGKLNVTVAKPFSCSVGERSSAPECTNWRRDWPRLIEQHDPDVVLFHVTRWDPDEIASLSGSPDLPSQSEWAHRALNAGFDLLTARGATIVWSEDALRDMGEAVRRNDEPYYSAMLRLISERSDLRRRQSIGQAVRPLLADLVLYQRVDPNAAPRVMVVGDSIARTLSYGLERWSAQDSRAVVWSVAKEGCGVADDGSVRAVAGREVPIPRDCKGVAAAWAEAIHKFKPDVVIVLSAIFDLQDRRLEGWPEFLKPGDRPFDDYVTKEYVAAYDTLSAGGAKIVWFRNPCVNYTFVSANATGALDAGRIRYANSVILDRLAKSRPAVRIFDLFQVLCPAGRFVKGMDGVKVLRTDGVHFSAEGSLWFAEKYGRRVLDLGLG